MRKRAKRTSTRRSLGALSRLEICGRAHDVRSSGSRQYAVVRDSVDEADPYSTERVDGDVVVSQMGGHEMSGCQWWRAPRRLRLMSLLT